MARHDGNAKAIEAEDQIDTEVLECRAFLA